MDRFRSETFSRVAVLGLGEKATISLTHLHQAASLVDLRHGHSIQLVAGRSREPFCDGLVLLDGVEVAESPLPTLAVETGESVEKTAEALVAFIPELVAARARWNSSLSEMRKRYAAEALSAIELRALEDAQETWGWSDEETELIMARGARKNRENTELLETNLPIRSRDSRKGRFGWLSVREEMCNELGD